MDPASFRTFLSFCLMCSKADHLELAERCKCTLSCQKFNESIAKVGDFLESLICKRSGIDLNLNASPKLGKQIKLYWMLDKKVVLKLSDLRLDCFIVGCFLKHSRS